MNLLLVDDEPIALRKLERAVQAAMPDSTCNSFDDAEEAMEYAEAEKIDIAFLDINMSYMDGMDMAKVLKSHDPDINIVFCTGYSEYAYDAHEIYVSGYLLKPITEQKVLDVLPHLRHVIKQPEKKVRFQCFGNFEIFVNDQPLHFQYNRTKELLAYLVDARGEDCSMQVILKEVFENGVSSDYMKQLRRDLHTTLEKAGAADILRITRGALGICTELVECDYYKYLEDENAESPEEYMSQYSFAEHTFAKLIR